MPKKILSEKTLNTFLKHAESLQNVYINALQKTQKHHDTNTPSIYENRKLLDVNDDISIPSSVENFIDTIFNNSIITIDSKPSDTIKSIINFLDERTHKPDPQSVHLCFYQLNNILTRHNLFNKIYSTNLQLNEDAKKHKLQLEQKRFINDFVNNTVFQTKEGVINIFQNILEQTLPIYDEINAAKNLLNKETNYSEELAEQINTIDRKISAFIDGNYQIFKEDIKNLPEDEEAMYFWDKYTGIPKKMPSDWQPNERTLSSLNYTTPSAYLDPSLWNLENLNSSDANTLSRIEFTQKLLEKYGDCILYGAEIECAIPKDTLIEFTKDLLKSKIVKEGKLIPPGYDGSLRSPRERDCITIEFKTAPLDAYDMVQTLKDFQKLAEKHELYFGEQIHAGGHIHMSNKYWTNKKIFELNLMLRELGDKLPEFFGRGKMGEDGTTYYLSSYAGSQLTTGEMFVYDTKANDSRGWIKTYFFDGIHKYEEMKNQMPFAKESIEDFSPYSDRGANSFKLQTWSEIDESATKELLDQIKTQFPDIEKNTNIDVLKKYSHKFKEFIITHSGDRYQINNIATNKPTIEIRAGSSRVDMNSNFLNLIALTAIIQGPEKTFGHRWLENEEEIKKYIKENGFKQVIPLFFEEGKTINDYIKPMKVINVNTNKWEIKTHQEIMADIGEEKESTKGRGR